MIRINLLATERSKKKKSGGGGGGLPSAGALQSYLLLALFAGGAAVLCAGAWWLQSNKLATLDTSIAADTKRKNDLDAIKKKVDEFQQKKATLENKVAVIEMLRAAQKSPVHMLDEVSGSLPDYVWLTQMDETTGAVRFGGQSNSLAAVADFISALQTSGWFPSVELVSSQEQNSLVTFNLQGKFVDPDVAEMEKAAAEAAKAAAAPPEDNTKGRRSRRN
jgi:type IV pilus assembly protein PilN